MNENPSANYLIYFFFLSLPHIAIMAKVIAREVVPSTTKSMEDQSKSESVRFTLQVKATFRKTEDSVVSGLPKGKNISLYVFARDLDCKCPKIKIKKYVRKKWFRLQKLNEFIFYFTDLISYLAAMTRVHPMLSASAILRL